MILKKLNQRNKTSLYLCTIPIANDGRHRITGEIGDTGFDSLRSD